MTAPIQLTRTSTGEPALSAASLGLLFGLDADTVQGYITENISSLGRVDFPTQWLKDGRRRGKEASAATGSTDLQTILTHLARHDSAPRSFRR